MALAKRPKRAWPRAPAHLGAAYLENGDQLSGIGTGAYESVGTHVWRTQEIVEVSDGTRVYSEGEINLAKRTWGLAPSGQAGEVPLAQASAANSP